MIKLRARGGEIGLPRPGDLYEFGGLGYICVERVIDGDVEYYFTNDDEGEEAASCATPLEDFMREYGGGKVPPRMK